MNAVLAVVLALLPTTWTVGGPNSNFTDLPAAVAAAASGDTILVNPGNYTPFSVTGKALTIRGAGAATTVVNLALPLGSGYGETRIFNVPAGATFYVSGLAFAQSVPSFPPPGFTFPTAGLKISGGGGRVVLSDVTIQGAYLGSVATSSPPGARGLDVMAGAEVHRSRCTITGGGNYGFAGAGAVIQSSNLAAEATSFTGGGSLNSNGGIGLTITDGLSGSAAKATLARCSIHGGWGLYYTSTTALSVAGSMVRVAGSAADVIRGWTGSGATGSGYAIYVGVSYVSSSVFIHGPVSLLPSAPGGPVTLGPVMVGLPALPYVSLAGTPAPGGALLATQPVTVSIDGVVPSAPYVLGVAGTCAFAFAYPGPFLGDVLLPVWPPITLPGTLDASGMAQIVATPALYAPAIVGIPVYLQCAVISPGGQLLLSNGDVRSFQ